MMQVCAQLYSTAQAFTLNGPRCEFKIFSRKHSQARPVQPVPSFIELDKSKPLFQTTFKNKDSSWGALYVGLCVCECI